LSHAPDVHLKTDWCVLVNLLFDQINDLGLAAGAAYSWCLESNRDIDLAGGLDVHVFRDAAGVMGRLVHDFGNVYQTVKTPLANSSRLFWSLAGGEDRRKLWGPIGNSEFDEAEARVAEIVSRLPAAKMDRPDAGGIADEIRNAAAMLTHACRHGRWRLGIEQTPPPELGRSLRMIVEEHRRLWLARNRPGGLDDSCGRLESRLAEYT
jgi:hypothetical protein